MKQKFEEAKKHLEYNFIRTHAMGDIHNISNHIAFYVNNRNIILLNRNNTQITIQSIIREGNLSCSVDKIIPLIK